MHLIIGLDGTSLSPPLQLNCLTKWQKAVLAVAVDGTATLQ